MTSLMLKSKKAKLLQIGSRMVVTRGWDLGEWGDARPKLPVIN